MARLLQFSNNLVACYRLALCIVASNIVHDCYNFSCCNDAIDNSWDGGNYSIIGSTSTNMEFALH